MKQKGLKKMGLIMIFALIITMTPQSAFAKTTIANYSGTKVMYLGSTFALKVNGNKSTLSFSSNKKNVASITKDGVIYAKKKGNATVTIQSGSTKKKMKVLVKKPVGYTISKKAGTYKDSVRTRVKAQKGYTVYYTSSNKFKKSWKINSKKSKTFSFSKTSTLRLYPVKNNKKMTTAKLNKTKNTDKKRADYLYTIVSSVSPVKNTSTPAGASTPTPATNTSTPAGASTPTPVPVPTPGKSQDTGDDSASDYIAPARTAYDDIDQDTAIPEDAVEITLPTVATGSKVETSTYEISKKNKLTITEPGTYVIHTQSTEKASDGLIEAKLNTAGSGAVHLILDGVNLMSSNNTKPDEDTGLITFKKSVARAIVTVKAGTTTTLVDTGDTGIDAEDGSTTYTAGILCKKIPLTINGSGTLRITSDNGNGIKATNSLKILDTHICAGTENRPVGHNGISGKTELAVKNANLEINSTGDALKNTLDKADIEEDASLAKMGNMELDGGSYQILSTDGAGVVAYRTLYLNPDEMNVTTRNHAASTNLAASTKEGSYKGIKAGTTIYIPDTAGNIVADTTATYDPSRARGDSNDEYADDTMHCDGYIRIDGGRLEFSSGDDGIHSDAGLVINGGDITVKESYEGLESGDITINGGTVDVTARDDGVNAGGGNDAAGAGYGGDDFHKGDSSGSTQYQIIINGGTITVDANGDGIDSNGNIFFKGGTVTVNGPTKSGNGALDYGDRNCVCEVSGGTLIAAGAVGMDAAPTGNSSQPVVNVRLSAAQSAGTYVVLKDSSGEIVMTAQPTKTFQSVIMSCEKLVLGGTYTVYYGKSLDNLTQMTAFTFTSTNVSTDSSGSGNGSWRPGGIGGQPGRR